MLGNVYISHVDMNSKEEKISETYFKGRTLGKKIWVLNNFTKL